jgi:hypothetical protein
MVEKLAKTVVKTESSRTKPKIGGEKEVKKSK